ncbi:MAG: hypothetical protein L3K24_12520 [Gammaproteobacteria bacterium]|nr:hypothetical protein [Gammaproteobacteria bacterium]
MMKKIAASLFLLGLTAHAPAANAAAGGANTAFSKGATNIGIMAGTGSSFDGNYTILGIGVGYYIMQGLELGIDAQHWFSSRSSITKISPQIRYVFTQPKVVKPYLGAFYRRTFVDSDVSVDMNSYGYRAGAYTSMRNKTYIGGGIVYEQYSDCQIDCSSTYPEILFSIRF